MSVGDVRERGGLSTLGVGGWVASSNGSTECKNTQLEGVDPGVEIRGGRVRANPCVVDPGLDPRVDRSRGGSGSQAEAEANPKVVVRTHPGVELGRIQSRSLVDPEVDSGTDPWMDPQPSLDTHPPYCEPPYPRAHSGWSRTERRVENFDPE